MVTGQMVEVSQRDRFDLADLASIHPLGADLFVVHVYARLQVRAVTEDGDRFDYWVSDGRRQFGLEVSGTLTGDFETRHRLKAEQLLDNPFDVDGYVVVVDFSARRVIFSFHQYEESNA